MRIFHYHENLWESCKCEPQLRFLTQCCSLWFNSSILSIEVTVQCVVCRYVWAVPSKNINRTNPSWKRTRCKKTLNVCAFHSTVTNVWAIPCLSTDVMGSHAEGPTNYIYGLECLLGISDNIPTLACHGMKFIEVFILKA